MAGVSTTGRRLWPGESASRTQMSLPFTNARALPSDDHELGTPLDSPVTNRSGVPVPSADLQNKCDPPRRDWNTTRAPSGDQTPQAPYSFSVVRGVSVRRGTS